MTRIRPIPPLAQTSLLLGLGIVAVYAALIPLGPGSGMVPPDLLFCLVIAWTVRSPGAAPLWAVLLLGLFADLMLSRPLGLGALGLVLAAEVMRARGPLFRGAPFVLEWAAAVAAFALVLAGTELALRLTFAPVPGLGPALAYLAATALAYPLVVIGLAWGLQLGGPRPAGAGDRLGRLS